jgi:hypothetical protein
MGYIPNKDADFLAFATAFANTIAADPSAFMISPSEVNLIVSLADQFAQAHWSATNKATRTEPVINEKNQIRQSVEQCFRAYAQQIKQNAGIGDDRKLTLGLRLDPRTLSRRKPPESSPRLHFMGSTPGVDHLRFADANMANSRAKPFLAERLELFVAYVSGPPKHISPPPDARYLGSFKKNPIRVPHDLGGGETPAGKAVYWARWAGYGGGFNNVGPWSLPCSMSIAAKQPKEIEVKDAAEQALKMAA